MTDRANNTGQQLGEQAQQPAQQAEEATPETVRTEIPADPQELVSGPRGGQGSQPGGTTADGAVEMQPSYVQPGEAPQPVDAAGRDAQDDNQGDLGGGERSGR